MWGIFRRFLRDDRASVAPTVALSLVALFGATGLAFDYARLAAMDTELQQAADQAALAAATQLDRADGAQARASAAIQNATDSHRLAENFTRFANDDAGSAVQIDSITFCSAFDDSVAGNAAACTETTDDADSKFVIVQTSLRTANYAFTPIVAAFSGDSQASAVAGLESSICNIAPLFVCTNDANFPGDADIGKGLLMKTGAQNAWFPGNYGYLDFGPGNPAVIDALLGHGLNGCQHIDESNTEPGNKNATDAINTRFDVYDGVGSTKDPAICDLSDGTGCPDQNTGKDMTLTMTYTQSTARTVTVAPADTQLCGATGGTISYTSDFAASTVAKGMPRDDCHYTLAGCDDGNFGDTVWDYSGYMAANHPGVDLTSVPNTGPGDIPTRYDVYKWENTTAGALGPVPVGAPDPVTSKNGPQQTTIWTYSKKCNFRQPKLAAGAATGDRRILPVVAANCAGLNGSSTLDEFQALRVFDVFLTEPSLQRNQYAVPTDDKEIYGEVIGPAETFAGTGGFQYFSRNKPYLVR